MDYQEVFVAAIPAVPLQDLDSEDQTVPGTYSVQVQQGLGDSSIASVALDVFHENNPVGNLDDFEFIVFDPQTGKTLTEDGTKESYTMGSYGRCLSRVTDQVPKVFLVDVLAVADNDVATKLGTVQLVAEDRKEAIKKAHTLLWDPRLDGGSCRARYCTERQH
jgi:hypothetical protein